MVVIVITMKLIFRDICAVIIFLFIVGIFFAPTILKGQMPVSADALVGLYHPWRDFVAKDYPRGLPFKNFLITDPVRQQIPWRKAAIDQWKDRILPTWNPYNFSGASLIGNIQAGVFYPLNILFFLLTFPVAWTVLIILEPLLAGFFLYLFLRHKQLSPMASLFGAVSWSFSGFSVAWMTWGTIMHVALWLPLILLAIDKLIELKSSIALHSTILRFNIFVMVLCMQFFAGHAQISVYVLLLSAAYALWQLRLMKPKRTKAAGWLLSGFSLFLLIASIQWIPLLYTTVNSSRLLEITSWTKSGWFLPWQHMVQYLVPDFFGNPATMNYWGEWNYGEFIGYIGMGGLLFAGFSLLQWKHSELRFWIGALIVSILFVLPTPIAKLPYFFNLPVISALQPTRLTMIVDFALVVLAAYGFDAWRKGKNKRKWPVVLGLGVVLVSLWLLAVWQIKSGLSVENWMVTKRNILLPAIIFIAVSVVLILHSKVRQPLVRSLLIMSLIGIVAFDLLRFATKFTPFVSASYFFPTTKVFTFLQSQPKPFRVVSLNKEIMAPNTSAMYGIETIDGYDPIISARYEEYYASIARGKADISKPFGFNRILTTEGIDSPLIPLLNVRYVLSLSDKTESYLTKVFQEGQTRVYEDQRVLPRAYLVEEVKVIADKQKILDALYDRSFKPLKTAIVEQPISILSIPLTSDERATIDSYKQSSISISVLTKVPRLLVIANSWNPWWKATIDGKIVTILRTNYVLQGVVVPAGTHRIKLSYNL